MSQSQLSVPLNAVRAALASDLPGTLRRVADLGYQNVELFGCVDLAHQLLGRGRRRSAADLLRRLGGRVQLIHVKDGSLTHDDQDKVTVGSGKVDILAAAPPALRVVELDGFNGDVDALADSFAHLTVNAVSA